MHKSSSLLLKTKKTFVLVFMVTVVPFSFCNAQQVSKQSVIHSWENFKNYDSQKAQKDSLFALSGSIVRLKPAEALPIFTLLDSLVLDPKLKLEFYRNWSISVHRNGDYAHALRLRHKGLQIATDLKIPSEQYDYTNSLATYYINKSQADSASYYAKNLELLVAKFPDQLDKHLWTAYMRNASVEGILGNPKKQGEYLERAYVAKSKFKPDSNLGFVLYAVNNFFRQQSNPDKSAKYTELLVQHYKVRKINTPDAHFPIDQLLLSENTPEAIAELKKVIISSEKAKLFNAFSASNTTLARAYIKNNEPEKAIPVLKHGIAVLNKAGALVNNSAEIALLQEAYALSRDFENAYQSLTSQKALEDSLRSSETLQYVADFEVKYKTAETQLELEKKNAAQRLLYFIIGAAALLLGLITFFFLKNRKKNELLKFQKEKLQVALSEKEILLKEIHHRVKNNLQVISSLLSLQQRQVNDPNASKALQIGRDRVKAMSLIHQNLYQEGNLIGVSVTDYINKLANSLVANYKTENKKIQLNLNIMPINLDVDTIIPIGLIINELISNTLKYAFKDKNDGSITIDLSKEHESLYLSVKDDGGGFPDTFNTEETTTLGFRLIKAFSEKLKAKLSVDSSNLGTQVALQIPYLK